MKILYWDRKGYRLWYKRLEKGTFRLPCGPGGVEISATELVLLLEGIDLAGMREADATRPRSRLKGFHLFHR